MPMQVLLFDNEYINLMQGKVSRMLEKICKVCKI